MNFREEMKAKISGPPRLGTTADYICTSTSSTQTCEFSLYPEPVRQGPALIVTFESISKSRHRHAPWGGSPFLLLPANWKNKQCSLPFFRPSTWGHISRGKVS